MPEPEDSAPRPKRVVSISLGSSTRDFHTEICLLGQQVRLERRGVNGDLSRAAALLRELDGTVDALGLGGIDLYVQVAGRRYPLRESQALARHARKTPLVCGAGLKNTLERQAVERLNERIGWRGRRVLMVSGVDRFGMAEALEAAGADLTLGDLIFLVGLPAPLTSLRGLARATRILGPIVRQLPIAMLYPTGTKQDHNAPDWRARYFVRAEVVAGDFHVIRRYAPADLSGKTILTNTTTPDDVALLRQRGVKTLITTTPRLEGRSLPTNVLEAALVAASGRHPLSEADYLELIGRAGLGPDVLELN